MTVHITTFEIIGEGRPIADEFEAAKTAAKTSFCAFAQYVGGVGYRPGSNGQLRSVFFADELPQGWKMIGQERGMIEAMPKKSTKAGIALRERYADLPEIPQASQLARDLGYSPNFMPTGNGKIYFPSELRVRIPTERHFLRLPLTAEDGFAPDAARLIEVLESEFMRAVEDHNAEVRRQREGNAA